MINIIIPTNNMSIFIIIENTNIIISIYYVNLSANSRTYYCEILDKHSRQENKQVNKYIFIKNINLNSSR